MQRFDVRTFARERVHFAHINVAKTLDCGLKKDSISSHPYNEIEH